MQHHSGMYGLLVNFNPATLKDQIATHPGAYSRILNALCHLTESGLKCECHRREHDANRAISPLPNPR